MWAGGEASIPSLGAVFGRHLAANAEAEGVPLDRSIFSCQRYDSRQFVSVCPCHHVLPAISRLP